MTHLHRTSACERLLYSCRRLPVFLLLFFVAVIPSFCQQFASLSLNINAPDGTAITQANVSIRNVDTGIVRAALSDKLGVAVLPGLAAGSYKLTVNASGFSAYETPLTLTLGQDVVLNIAMRVHGATESVEVHDTVRGADSERTEASQVIEPSQISNLPIPERDFIDFVLLTPTATIGRSTTTAAQSAFQETVLMISLGGLRETHSVFYGLDGVDYNTSVSGVQRVSPSLDWVQEFRVTNTPDPADAGMNLGGAVNTITKSGTNDLHGSAYEYFRNNQLDANNLLSAPGFDTLRFNQYGATVGGPVRRDKAFYFLGYQGQRRAESPIYSHFILTCIDTPGCLGPGTPSINQVKSSLGLSPENLGSILLIQNYDNAFGKFTDALSDRSSLTVGYLFADVGNHNTPAASPGQGLPSSYRDNRVHDQTVYGNLFHLLNDRWASESAVNFGRRIFYMNPVGAGYEPTIQVADELYSGGFLGGVDYYSEHHFQSKEALTYTHDKNTIKIGGEFQPIWFSAQTPYFTPGVGIFSPQSFFGAGPFGGPPFGPGTAVEFIFQQPRTAFGQQIPARTLPFETGFYAGPGGPARQAADAVQFWHKIVGLYAQDQWRASKNLLLSFGVRYDFDVLPSAVDLGIIGKMNPTDFSRVQPRLGFAYALRNGKTVVRSNFSIFSGSFEYSSFVNDWHGASAFTHMDQPLLPDFSDPTNDLVGFGPAGMVGAQGPVLAGAAFSNFTHTGAYPSPTTLQQFPLGFAKRDFPRSYSEQANVEIANDFGKDWHLTLGYHYLHAIHLNSSNTVNGLPDGFLSDGRQKFAPADKNFGFVLFATPTAWAIYNAGTIGLRRDLANHFSLMANYTYSKSIDVATENQLQDEPQDYLQPQLDKAVGDNDVRHRLTLTALGTSPETWVAPLRNFELSMVNTLQSPQFYSILAGSDINGDGFPFNDRVGDIGRNSYRGDSYYDTDVRLQRTFAVTERVKANARVEALNLLNRVNVQDVDQVYGSGEFGGPVPKKFGDGVTSPFNPTFGSPTFAGAARQFQFSLKLEF
ncbi:hypothetical protein HNQ77_003832 [Silvibacterium bohemicum]|uniref:TonB-dependent transporter Oar-like beta-barrel domain-containing protein n=1 Tax=Silvibacterium bohemicum TaxID=1577686 RepID=A0A841JWW4_9BACT|nr:carboxypeptidase regulatory-like domain-containing protein [Silvibacterium bohemicum]MBB6145862.1 hypothetical protein [Silvibacterium bohemicum]